MKVLNLQCARRHGFEGWFASEEDFQSQRTRGLVACPLCSDTAIQKLPSAPRLNLRGATAPPPAPAQTRGADPVPSGDPTDGQAQRPAPDLAPSAASQAAFLDAVRQVMQNTEDVGSRFAEEARRIHYGEAESRHIRGQTSPREAVELIEEGIDVMPLPLPAALKHTLQ